MVFTFLRFLLCVFRVPEEAGRPDEGRRAGTDDPPEDRFAGCPDLCVPECFCKLMNSLQNRPCQLP